MPDTTPVGAPLLAIDPGTAKCGIAVVQPRADGTSGALHREVVETERLVARVLPLVSTHSVVTVLIGNATNGAVLRRALRQALPEAVAVVPVDEAFTSQRARVRFQLENQPRGWRKLVPIGLRTPPRAYDDYVAQLLAEDYLAAEAARKD